MLTLHRLSPLAHDTWGTPGGAPLLLLHGFTGSRHAWDGVRPLLAPHVEALAVDLPGHGGSAPGPRVGREGFLDTVAEVARAVRAWGRGPVDVVGYSQGARLALALAVEHPGCVRRLVLESGSPGLHGRKDRAERRMRDNELALALERQGVAAFMDRWEALPLFAGLRRLPADARAALRERRTAHTAEGLAWALRSLGTGVQPDYWPSLPLVRCPTLLLSGAEDAKFTALARKMAAELPTVWRRSFEGAGHAPHLEAPGEWAAEVLGFVATPWYESPVVDRALLRTAL
jgi:2-succinyl-6-hydroxy-2,4-cyclohexadiene-1-carboxylate synthase